MVPFALFLVRTTGTHIGRFVQQLAVHRNIRIAKVAAGILGARLASTATSIPALRTAEISAQASLVVDAIIGCVTETVYKATMILNFTRDCCSGTVEPFCDIGERHIQRKVFLDNRPVR